MWFLGYEVKKAFDNINRNRLKNIFFKWVSEPRLWDEISKMFNVGILDMKCNIEKKSVFQGSVLFPFLFNVYMNELDLFMEKLMKKN